MVIRGSCLKTGRPSIATSASRVRCPWSGSDPLYIEYHDTEWGVPVHDDRKLFEFLVLEGMQAGLSWLTILRKRENFRRAFEGFDAAKIAKFDARKVKQLMADPGIIRNKLKILATIGNARAFLAVRKELGTFDNYIWQFVGGKPKINRRRHAGHRHGQRSFNLLFSPSGAHPA